MIQDKCPDAQWLESVVLGVRPDPDSDLEILWNHLAQCESCARLAEQAATEDTLVEMLRHGDTIADEEPELRSVIEKAKTFPAIAAGMVEQAATVDSTSAMAGLPTRSEGESDQRANLSYSNSDPVDELSFLDPPLREGDLGSLAGFRILEIIGRGGMGLVFRAEDVSLQRIVALKIIRPDLHLTDVTKSRFLREARAMAAVDHENVVEVYRVDQHQGIPYVAMKFLNGQSLRSELAEGESWPQKRVMDLAEQVLGGLAAVHANGMIHRDIKPDNLWVEPTGRVKLLDFGLALADDEMALTQHGALLGTPAFMSPEQAHSQTLDNRSDLFSVGAVLYRAITGTAAFQGATIPSILISVAKCDYAPITQSQPGTDPAVSGFIEQLLSENPDDRFASADDARIAAARIFRQLENPEVAASDGSPTPSSSKERTPPRRIKLIAAGLVPLAVAMAIAFAFMIRIDLPGGTVEVSVDGLEKPVQIDVKTEGRVVITDPFDGVPIYVSIDPEGQQLHAEKAGFSTFTKHIRLGGKPGQQVHIRFQPTGSLAENATLTKDQTIARWIVEHGGTVATQGGVDLTSLDDDFEIPIGRCMVTLSQDADESSFEQAAALSELSLLSISKSNFTGVELKHLASTPLRDLFILWCPNFDDKNLRFFDQQGPSHVVLHGTSSGDEAIEIMRGWKTPPVSIKLGTNVTPKGLQAAMQLPELYYLSLVGCGQLKLEDLQILEDNQSIESIYLPTRLTGPIAFASFAQVPNLSAMDIGTFSGVEDVVDLSGITELRSLRTLSLSTCKVPTNAVEELCKMTQLEELRISLSVIDAHDVQKIASSLPSTRVTLQGKLVLPENPTNAGETQ